jgi:hypothetical protein
MMNFPVLVDRKLIFWAICFCQFVRIDFSIGQVSRLDVDEASDIVYSNCSENQFSIFIFRYPEIGQLEPSYSALLDDFSSQPSVFLVDIRMEPIPGCSRPKLFDLCGYTTLNPYMKYKPFLAFISNAGSRWSDFQKSEYFISNKNLFLPVTDKEGNRAPFLIVNSFDAFKVILDYLKKNQPQNYSTTVESGKGVKIVEPGMDSARILHWISSMIDARKPIERSVRGYIGFKVSALSGSFREMGSMKAGDNFVYAVPSSISGHAVALSYEFPLLPSAVMVDASQRFEVGIQSVSFSSLASRGNWSSVKTFSGLNLFASYSIFKEISITSDLDIFLGASGNITGRLPYTVLDVRSLDDRSTLKTGINPWDIGFSASGGLRHSFRSQVRGFLDLGFNLGLLNFDQSESEPELNNTSGYKMNFTSISAGFQFPIK